MSHSLSTGVSPTVNARVAPVRKAQLKKLAAIRGVQPSDLIREAIDTLITGTIGEEKRAMMLAISE